MFIKNKIKIETEITLKILIVKNNMVCLTAPLFSFYFFLIRLTIQKIETRVVAFKGPIEAKFVINKIILEVVMI